MTVRFAFAGVGIRRRAELRGDAGRMSRLLAQPGTRVLPFQRGKPLVLPDSRLCWLEPEHDIFTGGPPPAFVGMLHDLPRFAAAVPDRIRTEDSDADPGGIPNQPGQICRKASNGAEFVNLRSLMTAIPADEAELSAVAKVLLDWHATHRHCPGCGQRTEITHSGWRQHCGGCRAEHFCRTDPVVIMLITHRNSVLIGRSRDWPNGMHSLLAGFVEPGETIEAAVCRETYEETGVTVEQVRYLASQPWPFPASLMIGCSARATETALRIDREELENALWVSRERMAEIFAGRDSRIRPPRQGSIAEHMIMAWLQGRTGG